MSRCRATGIALIAILAGGAASCSNGVDPDGDPPTFVQPPLTGLLVDDFYSVLTDGGIVAVRAQPSDSNYRLGTNERVRVWLAATSGDSLELDLEPELCDSSTRYRTLLAVVMDGGQNAASLAPLLETMAARLWSVSSSGDLAGVRVFDSRDVPRALIEIASQSGVASVYRDAVGCPATAACPSYQLLVAAPLDAAAVLPGDKRIQASAGDTLTVWYVQPDAGRIETSRVIP